MANASDERRREAELAALMVRFQQWCLDRAAEDRADCAKVPPEFDALRLH